MRYRIYRNLDLVEVGKEVLQYWKENNIFKRSIEQRNGNPNFSFYEGPPSANGTPGIHHVMARTIKDIFCRYKSLQGYYVKRKGGWDAHGLPVELQVEKELGIDKAAIGKKISIKDYNQKCHKAVLRYKSQWETLTEEMGFWIDMDDPYITSNRKYIESVWNLLKRLYQKKLLYKGYTVQPYSPKAGTALSSHELNQHGCYRPVKDISIVAQFKILNSERDYFLAWTTTPWTLPSNMALIVGETITYVKVKTFNPYTHQIIHVILAKDSVEKYFDKKYQDSPLENYCFTGKQIPYIIIGEFKGTDLLEIQYEQLLPYVKPEGKAFYVIAGDFVSTKEGTGIVHAAPTFGSDDFKACKKNDIPGLTIKDKDGKEVPLVDKLGKFAKEVTDFSSKYVKSEYEDKATLSDSNYQSTDLLIAIKLKRENKAFKIEKYEHNYPHCWRTDTPILYYPMNSWFVKTTAYKDRMMLLNKTINWKPENTGIGRFGNWLENIVDWNLSRSRFWGTPLPIWSTKDGKEEKCIGSIEELSHEIYKSIQFGFMSKNSHYLEKGFLVESFDLHRPFIDAIVLASESGRKMFREPDLVDVWFDSGAVPFAQWHYPFENQKVFDANFPADYIAEGVDQTRGWFFTLHAISVMLEHSVAFKNVISNGLVLDKKGNKMSKRLGNTIDPFTTIRHYGIDAVRWYMISSSAPWENLKFDIVGLEEVKKKFFSTLHNSYSFFALYANLDGFFYKQKEIPLEKHKKIDKWIMSCLNTLVQGAEESYQNYEPMQVARQIQNFTINDLSNWYIRLNRKRFWKESYTEDKITAYQTLYTCLLTIAKLIAPIAPFYADRLYRDLNKVTQRESPESVHLTNFPKVDLGIIDKQLEKQMKVAQKVVSLIHSLRKREGIKVRQPLSKVLITASEKLIIQQIKATSQIILSEVNIKSLAFLEEDKIQIFFKKIYPNLRILGEKYRKLTREITEILSTLDQKSITLFEKTGMLNLKVNNQLIVLTLNDVCVTSVSMPGWSVIQSNGLTIAIYIKLNDTLLQEGISRELVNKIQNLRKSKELAIQDKIFITIQKGNNLLTEALRKHKTYICTETQAFSLKTIDHLENPTKINIANQEVFILIEKRVL